MMSRAVPASVVLHALAFAALLLWGDKVTRQDVRTPSVIAVRLVEAPRSAAAEQAEAAEPEPVSETAPSRPEPTRPPKEIPKEKPKEPPKEKPKPTTRSEAKPAAAAPAKPAGAEATTRSVSPTGAVAPSVSGTDTDFPFAYYLQAVESKIVANWHPRQLGFGKRAVVSCSVHFVINRAGVVSQVRLVRNSGLGIYDREALRAVQIRLPPLPPQYKGNDLGVTFDFNLEPGSQ